MAVKVGEMYAELGLRDTMTKDLAKADRVFTQTGKGMDASAKLGLDDSGLIDGLDSAKRQARVEGGKIGDELADGLEGSSGKVERAGSGLGAVMVAGVAGAAAVGGALVVEEFTKALDREADQAKAGIKMGLTPEMSKAAGEVAGDIYTQAFGDSLGEVNEALGAVGMNMGGFGDKSKEEVDELTKGVLTLADVFGVDLNEVTAAAGTMMKTGLAKNGMEALSIITRGLQSPANKADDLLETFTEYSTQFRKLGIDGPTALGLLTQGLAGGARDADIVADAFKEFSIRAIDGSELTAGAFASLGLDATAAANVIAAGGPIAAEGLQNILTKLQEIKDPVEQNRIGVALFGTQWEDMGAAVNGLDLTTAKDQVGGLETAMADATTATDTNAAKIESWKRGAQENISDWIANSGIPAIEGFTADLEDMGDQWNTGRGLVGEFHGGLMILGDGLIWLRDEVLDPVIGQFQTLFGWIGDTIEKAEEFFAGDIGQGVLGSAAGMMGAPGAVLGMLGFDSGGVVPGARGAPQVALVHGGETILPTHKSNADRWVTYEDGSTGLQRTDGAGNWRGVRPQDDPATYAMKAALDYAAAVANRPAAQGAGAPGSGSGTDAPIQAVLYLDGQRVGTALGRATIPVDRKMR